MAISEKPATRDPSLHREGGGASIGGGSAAASVPSRNTGLVRTNGRAAEVVMFEEAVVGFFVDAAEILGVPKSVAVIYGLCFANSEPLSFAEINERLEISQGSISQGLRVLRDFGALRVVQPTRLEGRLSRSDLKLRRSARCREFYTPELKLREFAARWIEQRLELQLLAGNSQLQALIASVPPEKRGSSSELMARLQYLQNWHQQSQALVPIIKTFLKLT